MVLKAEVCQRAYEMVVEACRDALERQSMVRLSKENANLFQGKHGVYLIYYCPDQHAPPESRYRALGFQNPIYVGKAGGKTRSAAKNPADLRSRLLDHKKSLAAAKGLDNHRAFCKVVVVPEEHWSPMLETWAISAFHPPWNLDVAGFGNHDPGSGRRNQKRSDWDVLYPGRPWAHRLPPAREGRKQSLVAELRQKGILL